MRKLAVLMLALLVLSGCAMLPVAAAPVPGGRPAGRMENVWYVPNKPVERLEPTQLLETENGIVLWGSGEIVLLDVEDLSVRVTKKLEAGDRAYLQQLDGGLCLSDPDRGTAVILDGELEVVRVLETEPGADLLLLSMDARECYTIRADGIVRGTEVLGHFRRVTVAAVENGRVILSAVGTEDLLTRWYVLDLADGTLTEQLGAERNALSNGCLPVSGDRWLRIRERSLLLYAEDGGFLSRTQLSNEDGSRCSGAFIWSGKWQGWLFLDHTPAKTRLMFWDTAMEVEGDPLEIEPETVPAGELLEPALYARAAALSEAYHVDIRIGEQAPREYSSYTARMLSDPELTGRALDLLEDTLSRYPQDFLRQLPYDDVRSIRIELVEGLEKKSEDKDVSDSAAFSQKRNGYYLLVFDARLLREGMIYHEITHILDKRLAWEAGFREDALFREEDWMALQPEGFAYAGSYNKIPDSVKKYYDSGYFVQDYACVSAGEDRATMLEKAMLEERAVFAENPGLMPKLRWYCGCIRDSFDTTHWPEATAWEQLLKE